MPRERNYEIQFAKLKLFIADGCGWYKIHIGKLVIDKNATIARAVTIYGTLQLIKPSAKH